MLNIPNISKYCPYTSNNCADTVDTHLALNLSSEIPIASDWCMNVISCCKNQLMIICENFSHTFMLCRHLIMVQTEAYNQFPGFIT